MDKEVAVIKDTLDWAELMKEARDLGLTPEQVSNYLKSQKEEK